jgi:hypothetical protein
MANATEFPSPGSGHGLASQIASERSTCVVVRNSRILAATYFAGSVVNLAFSVMFLVLAASALIFQKVSSEHLFVTGAWLFAALVTGLPGLRLWKRGRSLLHSEARLDSRGIKFHLGFGKHVQDISFAWDEIVSITRGGSWNARVITVSAIGGRNARFSSSMFFRPGRLAGLIASRTGLPIQSA